MPNPTFEDMEPKNYIEIEGVKCLTCNGTGKAVNRYGQGQFEVEDCPCCSGTPLDCEVCAGKYD